MSEYAIPVIDWLDGKRRISRRYFREVRTRSTSPPQTAMWIHLLPLSQRCIHKDGTYLKDLTLIEPDLSQVFIIDNSPSVYTLVPGSFFVFSLF